MNNLIYIVTYSINLCCKICYCNSYLRKIFWFLSNKTSKICSLIYSSLCCFFSKSFCLFRCELKMLIHTVILTSHKLPALTTGSVIRTHYISNIRMKRLNYFVCLNRIANRCNYFSGYFLCQLFNLLTILCLIE